MKTEWKGFPCEEFEFEGRRAIVVSPRCEPVGKLVLKTEYWGAFPDVELQLLERGYHLAYVKNSSRMAPREDCDVKARFVKYLSREYGVSEKCIPVGMSLGGAHAVKFAGFYPELVSCMYIDAPVLSFIDHPGGFGYPNREQVWEKEFLAAYPGMKRYRLFHSDIHPICAADTLIAHKIPVLLVYGDNDTVVNYNAHGRLLEDAMEGTGLLEVMAVPMRGHHPHGLLKGNAPIVDFILANS